MHRNYYSDDVPAKENRTWQRETTATSFNAFPGYEKDPRYTLHPPHLTSQAHNAVPPLTDSVQGGQAYNVTSQPPAPPNTPTFPGRPLNSASHLAPGSRYPSQTNFDPSVPGTSVTYTHPYGGASGVQSSRPPSPRQQYQSEYGYTSVAPVAQNQPFVPPNPDFNRLQELLQPENKELGSVLNWLEIEAQQRNRLQDEETRDPFVVQYPDQNETYEMRSQRNWRSGRSQHGRFGGHTSGRGRSEWRTGRGNYSRQNRNLGHSADHFQDQAFQASSAAVTQQQRRRSTGLLTIPKISQQVQEPVAIPGLDTASATNSSQTRLPDSICGENANFHELTGNPIVISQDREGRVDEVRMSKPGLNLNGLNTDSDSTVHHLREVPTSTNGLVEEPSADKQAAVNDFNAQQRQPGDVLDRDQTVTVKPRSPNQNLWLTRPPIRPEDQKEWRSKKTLDEYRMFQEEVIKPRMDAFKSGQVVPRDPTITGTRWRIDGPRERYVNGGWSRFSTKLDNAEDSLCSGRAVETEEQSEGQPEGQSKGQWQQPDGQHSSIVQVKAANSATGTYINGLGTLVSTTSQMSSASSENTSTLSFDSYHATGTVDASGYPAQDFSGQANGNPYHQGYFVQNQAIHNAPKSPNNFCPPSSSNAFSPQPFDPSSPSNCHYFSPPNLYPLSPPNSDPGSRIPHSWPFSPRPFDPSSPSNHRPWSVPNIYFGTFSSQRFVPTSSLGLPSWSPPNVHLPRPGSLHPTCPPIQPPCPPVHQPPYHPPVLDSSVLQARHPSDCNCSPCHWKTLLSVKPEMKLTPSQIAKIDENCGGHGTLMRLALDNGLLTQDFYDVWYNNRGKGGLGVFSQQEVKDKEITDNARNRCVQHSAENPPSKNVPNSSPKEFPQDPPKNSPTSPLKDDR